MATCTKCGADNPAAIALCHHCGQALSGAEQTFGNHPSESETPARTRVLGPIAAGESEKTPTTFFVLNLVLFVLIQVVLVFVVPVFAAMFADYGAKLPTPTQIIIDAASFHKNWGWMLNPVLVLFLVNYHSNGIATRRWLGLGALFQILLLATLSLSMFLPIFQLGEVANGLH